MMALWIGPGTPAIALEPQSSDPVQQPQSQAPPPGPDEQAPVGAKPRRFQRGQDIELKDRNTWKPATIQRVSGELYLIATKDTRGKKQFFWIWVNADRLRAPGDAHEGPDVFSQFGQRLGNDSIKDSARKAKQAYQDHQRKQTQSPARTPAKPDTPNTTAATAEDAATTRTLEISEPDRSAMQQLPVHPGQGIASLVPDPGQVFPLRQFSAPLRAGKGEIMEKPRVVAVHGRFALVVVEDARPGKAKQVYVERFNLAAGRSDAVATLDPTSMPLAVSPDGQLLAARANGFHSGSMQRLDIWEWDGPKPQHVISFQPTALDHNSSNDILSIHFINPQHMLVRCKSGTISAWEPRSARGLWEVTGFTRSDTAWAISPGGKYIATSAGNAIVFIDALTGQTLGSINDAAFKPDQLAFSPDGRYLVATGQAAFKRWDLKQHQALPSVALPPNVSKGLMVNNQGDVVIEGRRYHPESGRYTWQYVLPRHTIHTPTQDHLLIVGGRPGKYRKTINTWKLPASQPGTPQSPSPHLLEPGTSVSLDLSRLKVSSQERQTISDSLVSQFEERGVRIAKNQPVRLTAMTTTEREKRTYQTIGASSQGRQEQTINVDINTTQYTIEVQGVPAWTQSVTTAPSHYVQLGQDQSIQQAVQESEAGHLADFIASARIPDIVPDPRQEPAGTTEIKTPKPQRSRR